MVLQRPKNTAQGLNARGMKGSCVLVVQQLVPSFWFTHLIPFNVAYINLSAKHPCLRLSKIVVIDHAGVL